MPISVKLFFALCAAIAAWILYFAGLHAFFPTPDYLDKLERLPADLRETVRQADRMAFAIHAAQGALLLVLAGVVTFARRSWARWLLATLIVLRYAAPAASTLLREGLPFSRRWEIYASVWWSNPLDFVWLGIWALVIVLMFLPNARPWFRRTAAA